MLNKNDPLVGAIQDIMKKNQTERDAVKAVNEKFGVQDRKVLPREKQGEWNAAYQEILTEGFKGKQGNLDANKNGRVDGGDFPLLKKGVRPVAEGNVDTVGKGENEGGSAVTYTNAKKSMGDLRKGDAETDMGRSENLAHQGNSVVTKTGKNSSSVTPSTMKEAVMNKIMKKLEEKKLTKAEKSKREKIVTTLKSNGMNPDKAYPIATATAKKVAEENEGFNNRHDLSVTASVERQVVADQLNERLVDNRQRTSRLAPMHTQGIKQTKARLAREPKETEKSFGQKAAEIGRGVEASARGVAAGLTDFGQTSLDYKPLSDYALDAITPGRGENLKREFPTVSNVSRDAATIASMASGAAGITKAGLKAGIKNADNIVSTATKASTVPVTKTTAATTKPTTDILSNVKPTRTTAATTKPTTDTLSNVKPTRTTAAATTTQTTTAAGNAAAAALARNKSRISAVRRPAGAKPVQSTAKPQTATSGTSVPQVAQGAGQGNRLAATRRSGEGPWGSSKPPEVKAQTRSSPSGTFAANLQRSRQAAQTAQSGRVGGSTVGATQSATRAKLAQTSQSGRVGGSTVGATQQAAKLAARQRLSATARDIRAGAGKVVSTVRNNPKLAAGAAGGAALGGFAATQLGNKPPETQAGKPSTVAMTARKIEATPRKVSDTEIMNAPEYKQGVKAVGGEAGARKIQAGTDVAGVGKVDKGQTIWSKVKSQLEKQPVKGFEAGANKGGAGR
jgi:hypothetical protein